MLLSLTYADITFVFLHKACSHIPLEYAFICFYVVAVYFIFIAF